MQQFWGAGDFWQSLWTNFLSSVRAKFGDNEHGLMVYGTTLLGFIIYFGAGFVYMLLDLTNWPKWIRKYKIQPGTNEPVDNIKLLKVPSTTVFIPQY